MAHSRSLRQRHHSYQVDQSPLKKDLECIQGIVNLVSRPVSLPHGWPPLPLALVMIVITCLLLISKRFSSRHPMETRMED